MTNSNSTLDQLRADIDAGRATMADVDRYIADIERASLIAEAKAAKAREGEIMLRGLSRISRAVARQN